MSSNNPYASPTILTQPPISAFPIGSGEIQNVKIELFDDLGNKELFTETTPGTYKTGGAIQGQSGHSYFIRLETEDGKIFQSEPDELLPVGEIKEIRK